MGLKKDPSTSLLLPMPAPPRWEIHPKIRYLQSTDRSGYYSAGSSESIGVVEQRCYTTDTVRRILSFKGVLYLKHLLRGVGLGLFDDATAMEKFTKWSAEHDAQVKKRQEEAYRNKRARRPMPGRRPERRTEGGGR